MPKTLIHDTGRGEEIKRRVQALTPEKTPLWGKMSVDQMLHHVNLSLAESLGEYTARRSLKGLPRTWIRWMILNGPWGRSAPTRPDMYIAHGIRFDFAQEKARTLSMIDRIVAKPMESDWPESANFPMTGRHWSQLHYRHVNHHLTQFGV
jgi:hypothetical protein